MLISVVSSSTSSNSTALLARAESLKRKDNAEFVRIIEELGRRPELPPSDAMQLRYLQGWQLVYSGQLERAINELNFVISNATDSTVRFRAGVTVVNALAIAGRHQEGYSRLSEVIASLPGVTDAEAREQALVVAAILYNQAGQFELGKVYAERLLSEKPTDSAGCKGGQLRVESLFGLADLKTAGSDFDEAIAECLRVGEHVYANLIRTYVARIRLAQDDAKSAQALLLANMEEVQRTQFVRLIAEFDTLLAETYRKTDQPGLAEQHARRAMDAAVPDEVTKPLVDAYRVLYEVALARRDYPKALSLHERYMEADKGYLTEASARAMAFQAVQQQVVEKKQQIDTLSKQNQVLQLQRAVDKSEAERRGLAALLLLAVVVFIAMWLYKTKRSQLHFMKLARRDGLTGIFNRAHFADAAEAILAYCKKGEREACVVLIDLDDFKLVNDRHGHAAGDAVLKRAVQAVQEHLRSIDIMGRLGGEEFGIVLPDCDPEHARELAEQFRLAVADISSPQTGVGFPVSASFGVTSSRWSSYNLRQLIIHADKALYAAKNSGRNRVEVFDGAGVEPADVAALAPASFDRRRA